MKEKHKTSSGLVFETAQIRVGIENKHAIKLHAVKRRIKLNEAADQIINAGRKALKI